MDKRKYNKKYNKGYNPYRKQHYKKFKILCKICNTFFTTKSSRSMFCPKCKGKIGFR